MLYKARMVLVGLSVLYLSVLSSAAGDWQLPVGFSYITGYSEIQDIYLDNLEHEGYYVESVDSLPIGLSFQPCYSLESGLGFGAGMGPLMVIAGDASMIALPINLDLNYHFFRERKWSFYVRGGARYNLVDGDYVEGSQPGYYGNLGTEFLKTRILALRCEVGYDSSAIELADLSDNTTETIQPAQFMASLFATF
ncbi:hypothetical protein JXQ70_08840 [bacterium]|nr:hypothetical protein [bacterium]